MRQVTFPGPRRKTSRVLSERANSWEKVPVARAAPPVAKPVIFKNSRRERTFFLDMAVDTVVRDGFIIVTIHTTLHGNRN